MSFANYVQEVKKIAFLDIEAEKKLWQCYKEKGDIESRRQLIFHYQPLVLKLATKISQQEKMLQDLVQEGILALIESVETYDYGRGVAFSLFAMHRIRGQMLNYLQKERGSSVQEQFAEAAKNGRYSLNEENIGILSKMKDLVQALPLKEQVVFEGVYIEEQTIADIAKKLEVTTSYAYRLQKKSIKRLRGMLSHMWSDFS